MPVSYQKPLEAKRGGNPHDFKQNIAAWEAAVFDNAAYFSVFAVRPRRRQQFSTFLEALTFIREQPDSKSYLIYAVTEAGRTMIPDRDKWDHWLEREKSKNEH
jgi:hypothetical protein